jgi:hypothetical protein
MMLSFHSCSNVYIGYMDSVAQSATMYGLRRLEMSLIKYLRHMRQGRAQLKVKDQLEKGMRIATKFDKINARSTTHQGAHDCILD